MATAKKTEAPKSQDDSSSDEMDYQAEKEAQIANATGGFTGKSRLLGGPTQADLNPAYGKGLTEEDDADGDDDSK